MQFKTLKILSVATEDQKALQYLKRKFKTTTTTQLLLRVEALAAHMRKENCKEMYGKYKSEFAGEPDSEAELALKE